VVETVDLLPLAFVSVVVVVASAVSLSTVPLVALEETLTTIWNVAVLPPASVPIVSVT
jgi:hypothetical protein